MQQGGNKRGRQEGGGGKPSKKKYMHKAPVGGKLRIPLGSRGILVSCTSSKEVHAGREAAALFTEAYEALGGTWRQQAGGAADGPAEPPVDGPADIAAALASEVAELRDGSRQPLYYQLVGISSVVYLECRDGGGPSPTALVRHVCEAADAAHQNRTRHCSRFYPVEDTCFADMEGIERLANQVAEQHFPADGEPTRFAVAYEGRSASGLDRMQVIDAFAKRVPDVHTVDLGDPVKTILVNVVKGVCGVAVVERFKQLCRFNIRTLALPEEEREAQREAQRQTAKPPQQAGQQQVQQGGAGKEAAAEQQEEAAAAATEGKEVQAEAAQAEAAQADVAAA